MEPQSTTVLFLSANPKDTRLLRLNEERREIEAGLIERSRFREQFRLFSKVAVRPRDVQRAMLDYTPHVVHFSGHGSGQRGLVVEDEMGRSKLLDASALSALFELYADRLKCVLLNACYSTVQAEAISQHIPYVIGMSDQIGDRAAIEFAVAFYDALGAGRDVEFAYRNACVAIKMAGIPQADIPVLHQSSQLLPNSLFKSVPKATVRTSETYEKTETLVSLPRNNQIKFQKLSDFLKNGNWKEADQETEKIIGNERLLRIEDIEIISCEDWLLMDELWSAFSDNHFGFSVQNRIWIESGEKSELFNEIVGWKKDGIWMNYNKLTFDRLAPKGHLPTLWTSTKALGGFRNYLFARFRRCSDNL
ncbi:GUN4 domain-containing protein [Adonisia turfae]|uniref:CHAT domain-containing protein n=1 Tax=Adonisia turfae CCMR0081 TaxID=2292702 RepID=A0A6M0RCY1_9CYAN|nr:GUN4 domain-containing protein [Adonisia turfae]NEZ54157.1 CHAT domain-containing protein [Adonisia turfae CCMR0081]